MATQREDCKKIIGFRSEAAGIFYRNIEIEEFDEIIPAEAFIKK